VRLSANLGFLWKELPLPDAIRAAGRAGFDAVECHWPYQWPAREIRAVLAETGLPMVSLNTLPGGAGEFGLAALAGREAEAQALIRQAVDYAAEVGCRFGHVMAGNGGDDAIFTANLDFACELAAPHGVGILIEAINARDVPGYHVATLERAAEIVARVGRLNLKIMADCYHMQIMGGDLIRRLEKHLPLIGHVQIAAVPDRGEPDGGEVSYPGVARALKAMGYEGYLGAEYRPKAGTDEGLGWMAAIAGI